ncbi:MAG: phosphoribosylanthranilate isomerase [Deltaproteobacteria bacterium]|nr:MAG: phosphoribosylanthranilate isomerase [Deltaproteobacteria bacterium]
MSRVALFQEFIQIAGIIDREEAQLLIDCGVEYLGFPLRLPVHKEDLSEAESSKIIRSLTPPHQGVVITYLEDAGEITEFMDLLGARIVQLHGDIGLAQLSRLKGLKPDFEIVKSLVVGKYEDAELVAMIKKLGPWVEAFIIDTFDRETGACGATGKTHDWDVSRKLVELTDRPVILAGGLTPENVGEAILKVKPAGVDSHTGVEDASGRKVRNKVERFISEAKAAFASLRREDV